MPDVQAQAPRWKFKLTRVGVTGVKKPVVIRRGDERITLIPRINVYVDLPPTKKGSHLSRNIETLNELVDQTVRDPVGALEELAARIARRLLEKHEYASSAEVDMHADYFLERDTPLSRKGLESYELLAKAIATSEGVKKMVGVKVIGMVACPCAMECVKSVIGKEQRVTHNQRNTATLMLEVPPHYEVEANDLIQIVESSFSSPTYEILKRKDEGKVVWQAHQKPMFVEDVVREILSKVLRRYQNLPDEVQVEVSSKSEESIHKHDAFAERRTTLGELRR